MTVDVLIINHALNEHQDEVSLHPDVFLWEKGLLSRSKQWYVAEDDSPVSWYANTLNTQPVSLLTQSLIPSQSDALADFAQVWMVSPYHAQLIRAVVYVSAEGDMAWDARDAEALCDLLNPWLEHEGMRLLHVQGAMLLACREPMQVVPEPFGRIAGGHLPSTHHAGADGGRLNRLLSEIQMLLFQHPLQYRMDEGVLSITGLWVWGGYLLEETLSGQSNKMFAVATRNPVLQSLVEGKDAQVIMTEAERLLELIRPEMKLPRHVLLSGGGYAVWLTPSWLPKFSPQTWKVQSPGHQNELFQRLRQVLS